MIGVQKKFFKLLGAAADEQNLDVVLHYEWSNVGALHLQEKDSFDTWLSIPFSFNDVVSFGWMSERSAVDVFPGRPNPRFALFKANELDEAITYLVEYAVKQREASDDRQGTSAQTA